MKIVRGWYDKKYSSEVVDETKEVCNRLDYLRNDEK